MFYAVLGFLLGFSIPYLARRFAKFMPATFAYALYRIFTPNKTVSKQKRLSNIKYLKLRNRYFMRSLGWAITTSAILTLNSLVLSNSEAPWIAFFIFLLLLLMEIDNRIMYLPDILTSPLLIGGFAYATFAGNLLGQDIPSSTANSALGAIFGYLIPVIASLLMIKRHPDNMGGGDIKILSAIGAWFGLTNIPFVVLLSCPIFAISCYINKQKQGAFGPSIVIASLIMLFLLEY
ncbi:MAG: prepilin peptidase [Alphaproteobacteria bacterium]|nr:prepilin peptidase [Alphaproteobacteria bacterium]